ncbi:MAG: hypothetical protein HQ564_06870 [Candidatus Saganbacteria bacterium]|nr:hypothetical protein [Candidatus Saganbacteria bacterium]
MLKNKIIAFDFDGARLGRSLAELFKGICRGEGVDAAQLRESGVPVAAVLIDKAIKQNNIGNLLVKSGFILPDHGVIDLDKFDIKSDLSVPKPNMNFRSALSPDQVLELVGANKISVLFLSELFSSGLLAISVEKGYEYSLVKFFSFIKDMLGQLDACFRRDGDPDTSEINDIYQQIDRLSREDYSGITIVCNKDFISKYRSFLYLDGDVEVVPLTSLYGFLSITTSNPSEIVGETEYVTDFSSNDAQEIRKRVFNIINLALEKGTFLEKNLERISMALSFSASSQGWAIDSERFVVQVRGIVGGLGYYYFDVKGNYFIKIDNPDDLAILENQRCFSSISLC